MSATNHVLIITGKRQTGKSKELIELANDAAEVSGHGVIVVSREPLPVTVTLHNRITLLQGRPDRSPIDVFLDRLPLKKEEYPTHVFFDNVPQGCLSDLIHLAASVPTLNIAIVVQDNPK